MEREQERGKKQMGMGDWKTAIDNRRSPDRMELQVRTFNVKVSDSDMERLDQLARSRGFTLTEVVEQFLYDLAGGAQASESSCRTYAQQWFSYTTVCL